MVAQKGGLNQEQRNRMIWEIHKAHPYWSHKSIGDLVGLSEQSVCRILKLCDINATIIDMGKDKLTEPISATAAAKKANIPYYIIADWVRRKLVKVVRRQPGYSKGCRGNAILLDPVTLQQRIDRYKPRKANSI